MDEEVKKGEVVGGESKNSESDKESTAEKNQENEMISLSDTHESVEEEDNCTMKDISSTSHDHIYSRASKKKGTLIKKSAKKKKKNDVKNLNVTAQLMDKRFEENMCKTDKGFKWKIGSKMFITKISAKLHSEMPYCKAKQKKKAKKKLKCSFPECSQVFDRREELLSHKNTQHASLFICPHCKSCIKAKNNFRKHLKLCTSKEEFSCKEQNCFFKCKSEVRLNLHVENMHNISLVPQIDSTFLIASVADDRVVLASGSNIMLYKIDHEAGNKSSMRELNSHQVDFVIMRMFSHGNEVLVHGSNDILTFCVTEESTFKETRDIHHANDIRRVFTLDDSLLIVSSHCLLLIDEKEQIPRAKIIQRHSYL